MSKVVPTISGPKRPQDKVLLNEASESFKKVFKDATGRNKKSNSKVDNTDFEIEDGSILIAAITSCTNTSNPNVLIGAGLLAKKAVELGLKTKTMGQNIISTWFASCNRLFRKGRVK